MSTTSGEGHISSCRFLSTVIIYCTLKKDGEDIRCSLLLSKTVITKYIVGTISIGRTLFSYSLATIILLHNRFSHNNYWID